MHVNVSVVLVSPTVSGAEDKWSGERLVVANGTIPAGHTVMRIPESASFQAPTEAFKAAAVASAPLSYDRGGDLTTQVFALAAGLIADMTLGALGRYRAYTRCLPRACLNPL